MEIIASIRNFRITQPETRAFLVTIVKSISTPHNTVYFLHKSGATIDNQSFSFSKNVLISTLLVDQIPDIRKHVPNTHPLLTHLRPLYRVSAGRTVFLHMTTNMPNTDHAGPISLHYFPYPLYAHHPTIRFHYTSLHKKQ
jgi:hypothetical protein